MTRHSAVLTPLPVSRESQTENGMRNTDNVRTWIGWGILLIVALMPFHAFISVYLGSLTGHQAIIQAWKDILIVLLCMASIGLLAISPKHHNILTRPINIIVLSFMALSLLISFFHDIGSRQFWYGAKTDLEFLVLFLIAQLAYQKHLERKLIKIVIVTSTFVAAFGTIQVLFLDKNFLTHFGYGVDTLLPYHLVDPALPNSIRILSTLAGPNQLGSFLILPICLMLYLILKQRRYWLGFPFTMALFVLLHSYSRSAWIGAIVAVIITMLFCLKSKTIIVLGALSVGIGLIVATQISVLSAKYPKLQYYLLHSQSTGSQFQSSNQGHLTGFQNGVSQIIKRPWGQGLGSAGPASYQKSQSLITENYYLQIAIETGLIGLVLFLILNGLVALKLLHSSHTSPLAIPCFATLVGLAVVNLFLHAWSDSSTALVFWGIVGTTIDTANRKTSETSETMGRVNRRDGKAING